MFSYFSLKNRCLTKLIKLQFKLLFLQRGKFSLDLKRFWSGGVFKPLFCAWHLGLILGIGRWARNCNLGEGGGVDSRNQLFTKNPRFSNKGSSGTLSEIPLLLDPPSPTPFWLKFLSLAFLSLGICRRWFWEPLWTLKSVDAQVPYVTRLTVFSPLCQPVPFPRDNHSLSAEAVTVRAVF